MLYEKTLEKEVERAGPRPVGHFPVSANVAQRVTYVTEAACERQLDDEVDALVRGKVGEEWDALRS